MGDYYLDNFGQQFVFCTNKGSFFYADLLHIKERLILGKVRFVFVGFLSVFRYLRQRK